MANRYGLQIRAATAADAPGLVALVEFASSAWATGSSPAAVPPVTMAARLAALHEAGGAALIAVEWGPPSGLAVVTWTPTLATDLPVATLGLLLVAPEDRRRGIGRLLLKAASQAARSAGCGTLVVPVADPALRAFCEATGFTNAGTSYARALRKTG